MRLRTTARVDKGRNGKDPIESDKRMMYEQIPVRGKMKSFCVYIWAYKFFLKLALWGPRLVWIVLGDSLVMALDP